MKNRIFIFIYLFIQINYNSFCQNLVLNPSFESYSACPGFSGEIFKATNWDNPSGHSGTSDYYNKCSMSAQTTLPNNSFFFQNPQDGNGLVGLLTFSNFGFNEREYIQGLLSTPLTFDSCYYLSFYSNAVDNCYYFQNGIGICLTASPITQISSGMVLNGIPAFYSNLVNTDTMNWTRNESFYIALGNESIVTIGNFFTDGNFDIDTTDDSSILNSDGSYYLIDNVIVEKRKPRNVFAGNDKSILKNEVTFIGDTIDEPANYSWFPLVGLSNSSSYQTFASPNETTTYILTKTTPCGTSTDSVTVFVYENNYTISPNPSNGQFNLNYTSEIDATIVIYDALGRKVIKRLFLPQAVNQNVTLNDQNLSSGIYIYQIVDMNENIIETEKLIVTK